MNKRKLLTCLLTLGLMVQLLPSQLLSASANTETTQTSEVTTTEQSNESTTSSSSESNEQLTSQLTSESETQESTTSTTEVSFSSQEEATTTQALEDAKIEVVSQILEVSPIIFELDEEVTSINFPQLEIILENGSTELVDVVWTAKTEDTFENTNEVATYTYTTSLDTEKYTLAQGVVTPELIIEVVDSSINNYVNNRMAPPTTIPVVFDVNGNNEVDPGEITIHVEENTTIDSSSSPIVDAIWYYEDNYTETFIEFKFEDLSTADIDGTAVNKSITEQSTWSDNFGMLLISPRHTVWFDADENNEYDESVDLKVMVPDGEMINQGVFRNTVIQFMDPQPTGWNICGTSDRFVFEEQILSRKMVQLGPETLVYSDLRLCPITGEIPVYFMGDNTVPEDIYDVYSEMAAEAYVQLESTITVNSPNSLGAPIGSIIYGEGLDGYVNFEGWYTGPNGTGEKWNFGPDNTATVVNKSYTTFLPAYGMEGGQEVILLYPKAEIGWTVIFRDNNDNDLREFAVKEGSTLTKDTLDVDGVPLGELINGADLTLESGELFSGWTPSVGWTNLDMTWQFGENGTIVSGELVGNDYSERVIYMYPIVEDETNADVTVNFDFDGDGYIDEVYIDVDNNNQNIDEIVVTRGDVVNIEKEPNIGEVKWKDQFGNEFIFGVTEVNRNLILTPIHEVKFDSDGDGKIEEGEEERVVVDGGTVTKPTDPDRGTPDKWVDQDGNEFIFDDTDTAEDEPSKVTKPTELYPVYTWDITFNEDVVGSDATKSKTNTGIKDGSTIIIDNNGGVNGSYTGSVTVDKDLIITDPTKENHTFLGYVESLDKDNNTVLTAQWKQNPTTPIVSNPTTTESVTSSNVVSTTQTTRSQSTSVTTTTSSEVVETTTSSVEQTTSQDEAQTTTSQSNVIVPTLPNDDIGKVEVGGNEVTPDDYHVNEDGELELNEEFISTLPDGTHEITVQIGKDTYVAEIIVENGIPLSATPFIKMGNSWSLFDLVMTIIVACMMILMLMKHREEKEEVDDVDNEMIRTEKARRNRQKRKIGYRLSIIILTVITVLFFIFTQNISLPMQIFDEYSMYFGLLAVLAVFLFVGFSNSTQEQLEDDELQQAL